ncbi:hypothetical protein [Streptomyces lydicus]|uniref:hypothetical protein n=1 Tax=Streptomyces lydicus TaxID=47763 RepID=UPI000527AB5B|nr:hypothetical protein [Streptomyces lydicus]UEG89205.1 hypothetical protein LJ741_00790 [Streptomyces lydicus]
MRSFPGSPRVLCGAIVQVDPDSPLSRLVVFQYNPDRMTRSLQPRATASGRASDARRTTGAPVETVTMTVEVDAADQMEQGDPVAAVGIAPQLAALEMLLYPSTAQVVANAALLAVGTLEIVPPESPLAVLVWGPGRAVPVRIQSFGITEHAFTPDLFPTRASVDLSAQVLSYDDLPVGSPGYALFLVHQVMKEAMAVVAGVSGAVSAVTGTVAG